MSQNSVGRIPIEREAYTLCHFRKLTITSAYFLNDIQGQIVTKVLIFASRDEHSVCLLEKQIGRRHGPRRRRRSGAQHRRRHPLHANHRGTVHVLLFQVHVRPREGGRQGWLGKGAAQRRDWIARTPSTQVTNDVRRGYEKMFRL